MISAAVAVVAAVAAAAARSHPRASLLRMGLLPL